MAVYTATDWTVVPVTGLARGPVRIENGVRFVRNKMTLATAGTYELGGVPVKTGASGAREFGMTRDIDYINIYDSGQDAGRLYKYSATGNAIRAWNQSGANMDFAELVATTTNAAPEGTQLVLYVEAVGW